MNDAASLQPAAPRRGFARWADDLARGEWRASILCFVLLTAFYLVTAAGNLAETDDVYAFAYRAEHFELNHLSDPRLMLFHIVMRLLFLGATGLGLDVSALTVMRGASALCAAGALLLVVRIAFADLKLSTSAAVIAAGVLASCYGFWRYAAEGEVYVPSILLILLVFHGLSSLGGEEDARPRRRGVLAATGWGAFAGLAVLFYQPNVIPLFFAFPLLLARPGRMLPLCGYLAAGGIVVSVGYLIGFLAYWPEPLGVTTFLSFLSQRSNEFIVPPFSLRTVIVSIIRAAFALGHDIASANWIFTFDALAGLIHRAFSYNVITEEVFTARRAGFLAYLPLVTLLLLGALALRIVIALWPPSAGLLRQRWMVVLLAWTAINGAIVGRLNPAGAEAWIMLLPPLVLLFAAGIIEPCLRRGAGRLVGAFAAVLFLHNAIGGMALVHEAAGEYDRVKGAWVIAEAGPHDLVIVTANAGLVESLRYLATAEVALISVNDAPKVAASLLQGDLAALLTRTRGRDFGNHLLRTMIREAGQSGGRVILFNDFFTPPARLGAGSWLDFDKVAALREKAVAVDDRPGVGTTYVLPAPAH